LLPQILSDTFSREDRLLFKHLLNKLSYKKFKPKSEIPIFSNHPKNECSIF